MSQTPLSAAHHWRWTALEAIDGPASLNLPAPNLFYFLVEVTSYYNHPGHQPLASAVDEKKRIL
jgi:hypothetical protein